MDKLAIKGHRTRGSEIIELLEMLGGINWPYSKYFGNEPTLVYYINNHGYIFADEINNNSRCTIYTLEEFLEKYPYKVEDKVQHKGATSCGSVYEVEKMRWVDDHVEYAVKRLWCWNDHYTFTAEDIQPFEEESMEERKHADLRLDVDQYDKLATEVAIGGDKITPPKNHLIGKITKVDNGMLVEFVKKRVQYPKTYKECCDILSIPPYYNLRYHTYEYGYGEFTTIDKLCSLQDKLNMFGKLLICRDAYWKIAGEQMKLSKPWEPDWNNDLSKYYISFYKNKVDKGVISYSNKILAFPTEEMRDAFYENFKELIEMCKEIL